MLFTTNQGQGKDLSDKLKTWPQRAWENIVTQNNKCYNATKSKMKIYNVFEYVCLVQRPYICIHIHYIHIWMYTYIIQTFILYIHTFINFNITLTVRGQTGTK